MKQVSLEYGMRNRASDDTPKKVVSRIPGPAKYKFCIVCGKDVAIAIGAFQDAKRKLWTDENNLSDAGKLIEAYLDAKISIYSDSRIVCRNCLRRIANSEKTRANAKETFTKGRQDLNEKFSVSVTHKRGLPSDAVATNQQVVLD